jgi:hypothetical protein
MSVWALIRVRFDSLRLLVHNWKNQIGSFLGDPKQAAGQSRQALRNLVMKKWSQIGFTGKPKTMMVVDA